MERKYPESVGDVLRSLFEQSDMQGRLDELRAIELWPRIVGAHIAAESRKPTVKKGVMSVGVANAALRHELMMSRSRLVELLNKQIGKETIKEIKFIS